jgi:hypothetical protein
MDVIACGLQPGCLPVECRRQDFIVWMLLPVVCNLGVYPWSVLARISLYGCDCLVTWVLTSGVPMPDLWLYRCGCLRFMNLGFYPCRVARALACGV